MTARELVAACEADPVHFQLQVNDFIDRFRATDTPGRRSLADERPASEGKFAGLVSAIVSALCREVGEAPPAWVGEVGSPEPFFVLPASSFELRLRLMMESPSPFKIRRVFVPENYLSRA